MRAKAVLILATLALVCCPRAIFAEEITQHSPEIDPYPPPGKKTSVQDLIVDWRSLSGQQIHIIDGCHVTQASNMFLVCGTANSFIYISSNSLDRESLRFALKICSGWEEREPCFADLIIGRVGGVFLKTIPVLTDGYIHFRGQGGE